MDPPAMLTSNIRRLVRYEGWPLPDLRTVVLEGQEHVADVLAHELFADQLISCLREQRSQAPPMAVLSIPNCGERLLQANGGVPVWRPTPEP